MILNMLFVNQPCWNGQRGLLRDSCKIKGYAAVRNLLKLIVGSAAGMQNSILSYPIALYLLEATPLCADTKEHPKVFRQGIFFNSNRPTYNIDSLLMDMTVVNDVVDLDTKELNTR